MKLLVIGLAAAAAAIPFTGAASAAPPAPQVPGTIAVPAGNKPFLATYATGVQIYACNGSAWGLVAPRASLYGLNGKLVGTHFGGPSWQAKDGSTVVGSRVDGVTVDPTAIPWLLIKKASATDGAGGGDRLTETTYIQRILTTGGLAPAASECNPAAAGQQREITYTAVYVFWKKRS
jgi:Protein of unknown function (DUF3455)